MFKDSVTNNKHVKSNKLRFLTITESQATLIFLKPTHQLKMFIKYPNKIHDFLTRVLMHEKINSPSRIYKKG